jgi:hypothetical protein
LKTTIKLLMCLGLTSASFTRRHNEPRTDCITLRPQVDRRSSLVLHSEHNQE